MLDVFFRRVLGFSNTTHPQQTPCTSTQHNTHHAPSNPPSLQVLDALLAESARYFDVKSRRLAVVADSVSDNITRSLNSKNKETAGELQRLLPVQKYMCL